MKCLLLAACVALAPQFSLTAPASGLDSPQQAQPASPPPAQPPASPQPAASPSVLPPAVQWLQSMAHTAAAKSVQKQTQSISINHGSTSLIDESSGSDLLSTAFNLSPVSTGTAGGNANGTSGTQGSGTVTASLYSVYALASKQDPLTPSVYNAHPGLRKLFFTIGREQQNTTASSNSSSGSSPATAAPSPGASTSQPSSTPPASQPGTIYGAQWLFVNQRDATRIVKNPDDFQSLTSIAQKLSALDARYAAKVQNLFLSAAPADFRAAKTIDDITKLVAKLTKDQKAELDAIVKDYTDECKKGDFDNMLHDAVQALEHKPQFALSFQTTQRSSTLPNDYRAELIYDQGLGDGWLLTMNGSYDYSDSSKVGGDLRTERGALSISRTLVHAAGPLQSPLTLNLSGEGLHQDTGWHYRAQLQVVVPISTGVTFPLSFGYSDQTNVLRQEEKGVYGKFGLTFDFGKLIDALRSKP